MRKSPRSGAMFGLSWMICFGAILPLSPWLFLQMVPQAKFDFNTADIILLLTGAILFFTICLLIYAYGFLTFAKNFYTILRNDLKKKPFLENSCHCRRIFMGTCGDVYAANRIAETFLGGSYNVSGQFRVLLCRIYA